MSVSLKLKSNLLTYNHISGTLGTIFIGHNTKNNEKKFNMVPKTNIRDRPVVDTNSEFRIVQNLWGLDLDGTLQGSGGVGGLLSLNIYTCTDTCGEPVIAPDDEKIS